MTADEIQKKPLELVKKIAHASREDQVTSIISCACFEMFVEIAAQLSELNENLKAKSLTAQCDAHVHLDVRRYERGTGV